MPVSYFSFLVPFPCNFFRHWHYGFFFAIQFCIVIPRYIFEKFPFFITFPNLYLFLDLYTWPLFFISSLSSLEVVTIIVLIIITSTHLKSSLWSQMGYFTNYVWLLVVALYRCLTQNNYRNKNFADNRLSIIYTLFIYLIRYSKYV